VWVSITVMLSFSSLCSSLSLADTMLDTHNRLY
jgi:hypothetical protein